MAATASYPSICGRRDDPCQHSRIQAFLQEHSSISTSQHVSIPAFQHFSLKAYKHPIMLLSILYDSILACQHSSIPVSQQQLSMSASQHRGGMSAFQHLCIATGLHSSISAYISAAWNQHSSIPAILQSCNPAIQEHISLSAFLPAYWIMSVCWSACSQLCWELLRDYDLLRYFTVLRKSIVYPRLWLRNGTVLWSSRQTSSEDRQTDRLKNGWLQDANTLEGKTSPLAATNCNFGGSSNSTDQPQPEF